jgi:hypothetical protein
MNMYEISEEQWEQWNQEEQVQGYEDDYETHVGGEDESSLAQQHPGIDFSLHRNMTECTEAQIEDQCEEAMIAIDRKHDCMKDGQSYTNLLSKRKAQYYPISDFRKHYCIVTGINEFNGGEDYATVMENRMISDDWLAEDSEPNVNTVKNAFTPSSSKYTKIRDGALYVAIPPAAKSTLTLQPSRRRTGRNTCLDRPRTG